MDLASLPESVVKAHDECAFLNDPWGLQSSETRQAVLCGEFIATVREGLAELRRHPDLPREVIEALTPFDAPELAGIRGGGRLRGTNR